MIGVHTPETPREHDLKRLKKSIEERGLKYSDRRRRRRQNLDGVGQPLVALDLPDRQTGFVRYRWDGELGWKGAKGKAIMEKKIDELLAEGSPTTAKNEIGFRPPLTLE